MNRIPYLNELLGAVAPENIIVRKGLESRCFAHGQAAALRRIGMDESMAIFGNVAGDGGARLIAQLDAESVGEFAAFPVAVRRCQSCRE